MTKFITRDTVKSKISICSGEPVLDPKSGNAAVVPDVASDQGQVVGDGDGGDLKVRLEPGLPSLFDIGFDPAKDMGAVPVKGEDDQPRENFVLVVAEKIGPAFLPENTEINLGHIHGTRELGGLRRRLEPGHQGRRTPLLQNVTEHIRVEEVHQRRTLRPLDFALAS